MLPAALSLALVMQVATMTTTPAGRLEERPPASAASPLQAEIDRAAAGDVVTVSPGRYTGDIYIDHPMALVGRGRPTLVCSGRANRRLRHSGRVCRQP
jgi:nitrous oxidase accessory protein